MNKILNKQLFCKGAHCIELMLSISIILFVTWIAAKITKKALTRGLKFYAGTEKATQYNFFTYLITSMVYFVGIFSAITMIPSLQSAAFSILASSGIIALIAGFASQQAFANVISGFFIELFAPFVVGDYIRVNKDSEGIVEDITLRHTILKTKEDKRILIPNATLNTAIIENFSWNKK